jgi:putative zinc finger protein
MGCRRVRNHLSAYADGELNTAEMRVVEEHLARCERCAHEHKTLRQLCSLTALIPEEEVPADLHTRIMASLAYADTASLPRRPMRRAVPFGPWMCTAIGATAAALAVGFVQSRAAVTPARPAAPAPGVQTPASEEAAIPVLPQSTPPGQTETVPPRKVSVATPQPTNPAAESNGEKLAPALLAPAASGGKSRAVTVARKLERRLKSSAGIADTASQPGTVTPGVEKPSAEQRAPEGTEPISPIAVAPQNIMAMPGEPVVNASGSMSPGEPIMAGMEKEPGMMMAGGPAPVKPETPVEEDEGLRTLRRFLEERNNTIPQPPVVDPSRRLRRSL